MLTDLFSIEYWFRCMDLDGDGVLSMFELDYFYQEQVHKMEIYGIEYMPFEDCICQVCSFRIVCLPLLTRSFLDVGFGQAR